MNQLKHVNSEQRFPLNHYIITFGTVPGWPFPPTDTGHYMIAKTVFFTLFVLQSGHKWKVEPRSRRFYIQE